MFTGIVEELGHIETVEPLHRAVRLSVRGPVVTEGARVGDSIAVNGVCLTVTSVGDGGFTADVMNETLQRSSLGGLCVGAPVNLERPVTLQTRLGGHLVQGHVDGTGELLDRQRSEHWDLVRIALPSELARYVVLKGSITVDGVSLTVSHVSSSDFSVSLIPATLGVTTLGTKEVGDIVNLEVDVLAKYVERLMEATAEPARGSGSGA
ncbi:MAG TPA: riboflavin synthase [Actinomycetes bacterium]|nr:riboflavin synthase [Actinomycetes bacterium]